MVISVKMNTKRIIFSSIICRGTMILICDFILNASAWEGVIPNFPHLPNEMSFFKLGKDFEILVNRMHLASFLLIGSVVFTIVSDFRQFIQLFYVNKFDWQFGQCLGICVSYGYTDAEHTQAVKDKCVPGVIV